MDKGAQCYRRWLDGDDKAFAEIVNEYRSNLIFFVNGYVHDLSEAEDIAIDAFSDLVVHKHRYNFKVSLKTYLFMIGRSRALDRLRHKKKFSFSPLTEAASMQADNGIDALTDADERERALYAALDGLPENMRTAVRLVYLEGMSYDEAAKVLKKNRKQVDNLLWRAKNELRAQLGKDGDL